MKTIQLGKTGISVQKLGFGAMYLPRITPEESDNLLTRALELGIDYFDTASAYMDSEEKLGRVLSRREKDFTIMTRSASWKTGLDAFKRDFEQSFARLRLETLDFYGFHAVNQPPELELLMKEPLDFLREQRSRGRIKHIAITGHNPVTMTRALQTGEFAMVMFPFNVIEQEPLQELIGTANAMGVATSIMKPLAGGVIESKAAALRFFLSHRIDVITPGMMTIQELEENYRVIDADVPLAAEELQRLTDEVKELGRQFCRRCSYCMPCPNNIMIPFVHMLHMKSWGKAMNDDVAYTLELARRMLPQLEACDACGKCVEKCPYNIPTPQRVAELKELLAAK
jgi:predicted aldo/keto reductase-like oxidoreductase